MTGRSRFRFRFRGVMSLVKSIASQFFDILQKEEAASNTNVFYDPADLTSLRVGRDGSGGQPVVGDPVGIMMDTSQFGGKTAEDYLAEATNEIGEDWTLGSGWSYDSGSGRLTFSTHAGNANATNDAFAASFVAGQFYRVTFDYVCTSNIYLRFTSTQEELTGSGSYDKIMPYTQSSGLFHVNNAAAETSYIENIVIKAIPGHHAIAPSDSARPFPNLSLIHI